MFLCLLGTAACRVAYTASDATPVDPDPSGLGPDERPELDASVAIGSGATVDASIEADASIETDASADASDAQADVRADAAACRGASCGALRISDLTSLVATGAPGFANAGFRCKSLSVCAATGQCFYSGGAATFGSVQSGEDTFSDGVTTSPASAARFLLDLGAASQCGDPAITFVAGEKIRVVHDGASVDVYLPAFTGKRLELFIAADGSTYYDAALTQTAKLKP